MWARQGLNPEALLRKKLFSNALMGRIVERGT
jgi:hypothetical protein